MKPVLLDRTEWDFLLDAEHNIAVCTEPYTILQDVSSAILTWAGKCRLNPDLGLAHDTNIFLDPNNTKIFSRLAEEEAKKVPGVQDASALLTPIATGSRLLTGYISIVFTDGTSDYVSF